MKKKCYENPSVEVIGLLKISMLMISGGDVINTDFEYDDNPWQ